MSKTPPDERQDYYERAAVCRQRAMATEDPAGRAFWEAQERRWLATADDHDMTECVSKALHVGAPAPDAPRPEDGIAALVEVFHRACAELKLDGEHPTLPRKIACTILEAALDGDDDLDSLYARALKAAAN